MKAKTKTSISDLIGNTPLLRLNIFSEETGCEIFGKAAFLNPGGSVKDRAALGIIEDAERKGIVKDGGTFIEGTAGNTGISLTMICNSKGYKTVIVMPETQSTEKKDLLRILGADLRLVKAVPYKNPENYIRQSETIANELMASESAGACWANQFDNTANRKAHFTTTGPEIWKQTGKKIDGFICAVGTGGTLSGTGDFLRQKNPNIRIGIADPIGSSMYNFYINNVMKSEGSSVSEGIGQGRITKNLENFSPDFAFQIEDSEAILNIQKLMIQEGLYLGGSSAINITGAIKLAKELGPGHTICTILCDSGQRYQSKIWNATFLKDKGLPCPGWLS